MSAILESFLADVTRFCEDFGLSASEYGEQAMNDRSFLLDLKSGKREPRLNTIQKNHDFMSAERRKRQGDAA